MNPEQFARVERLFEEASQLPITMREAFVFREARDDPEVVREVQALLEEDVRLGGESLAIEEPIREIQKQLASESTIRIADSTPESIGPYRIVRECGRGGMGVVYEAFQEKPHRRVALKLIRADVIAPRLIQRFEVEAEALGRLQHPAIAQVFDAGKLVSPSGEQPFFVMEFIGGVPLTDFAESRNLGVRERLRLFVEVCDAAHHAHLRGIIHRDLKPANILVAEDPESRKYFPKVLDFGVAKLAESDLQRTTLLTDVGQIVGTLQYMSPEQARGEVDKVDRKSDIYALGVILFELLGNRAPYEVGTLNVADAVRVILDETPTPLRTVNARYAGDLDTIVQKCLEKDPARRYESALELAADVNRHLKNQPIVARPPSTWYRVRKFARRNRVFVFSMLLVMVTLFVGAAVATIFAVRSDRHAKRVMESESEARESERQALKSAYRASLAAALALEERDPSRALDQLLSTSPDLRGWEWSHLRERLSSKVMELVPSAPPSGVFCFSRDGALLLAGLSDRHVAVIDVDRGTETRRLAGFGKVTCLAASTQGTVAVGTERGTVLQYDLADGRLLREDSVDTVPLVAVLAAPGSAGWWAVSQDGIFGFDGSVWSERPVDLEMDDQRRLYAVLSTDGGTLYLGSFARSKTYAVDLATSEVIGEQVASEGIRSMALSADGKLLASGSRNRNVFLSDADSLEVQGTLREIEALSVSRVEFSDGGDLIGASGADGLIFVWDLESRALVKTLRVDPEAPWCFRPGRSQIAVLEGESQISLLGLRREPSQVFRGENQYFYECAFSPDDRMLAATTFRSKLNVWNLDDGERLVRDAPTPWFPGLLRFAPRGEELCVESYLGRSRFGGHERFDLPTKTSFLPAAAEATVWSHGIEVSKSKGDTPSGVFWDGYRDRRISGWEPELDRISVWRTEYLMTASPGCRAFVNGVELPSSREDAPGYASPRPLFLTLGALETGGGEFYGRIAEWLLYDGVLSPEEAKDVESYLMRRKGGEKETPPPVSSADLLLRFEASSETVEVGKNREVIGWRASNLLGFQLRFGGPRPRKLYLRRDEKTGLAVVDFKKWADIASCNLEAHLPEAFDLREGTVFWLGDFAASQSPTGTGWSNYAYSIGRSAGTTLPKSIEEFDLNRSSRLGSSQTAHRALGHFARAGTRFSRWIRVFSLETGSRVKTIEGTFFGLAYHPSGQFLAAAGDDGGTVIFETTNYTSVHRIPGHTYCVAFSPDGRRLLTGGNGRVVRIWDVDGWELVLELRGHEQYVKALAFSMDGSRLASASGDGTVRVWDTVPFLHRAELARRRREGEAALEPRVRIWWDELQDPRAVTKKIRETWGASTPERRAASNVLMRIAGSGAFQRIGSSRKSVVEDEE